MELLQPKKSRLRSGWELVKSSWHVLRLDKGLSVIPLISAVASIITLAVIGVLYLVSATIQAGGSFDSAASDSLSAHMPGWANLLFAFGIYLILTIIANFFAGAVVYGATERFRGGDPTIRSSLAGARRQFRPLLLFSIMMATVGFALRIFEERVPFVGKVAVWLVGAAWNIANFFAIPVIVTGKEKLHPFDATRRSTAIMRSVWGESIVANVGAGLVFFVAFLVYLLGAGLIAVVSGVIASTLHVSGWFVTPVILLGILGLVVLILVFTTLDSIIRAAIYHFATTGKAPARFSEELLRTAITPKKARKIFS